MDPLNSSEKSSELNMLLQSTNTVAWITSKYPIETLKHLSACQNICFLSRIPFRFEKPTNKNRRNSPFFFVACCLLFWFLSHLSHFCVKKNPWVRQKRPHATKSPKYSVAMNREDAGSGSNFFWPRKWLTKMLQNWYRIDRTGRWWLEWMRLGWIRLKVR